MQRLLTAIALIAVALYLIFWLPEKLFPMAALLMSVLCYREFTFLTSRHDIPPSWLFGLLSGLLLLLRPEFVPTGIPVLLVGALAWRLRKANLRDVLPSVACGTLGAFYTFGPWLISVYLRHRSVHLLFFALALNWVGDSAAYYAGRAFGRHKLAPTISPGKSIEGAVASMLASALFGLAYLGHFLPTVPAWEVALMAIAGNAAGQLGDLVESAIKRGANVKDSGSALPGHGGVLDRMDSSLFSLPIVYAIFFAHSFISAPPVS